MDKIIKMEIEMKLNHKSMFVIVVLYCLMLVGCGSDDNNIDGDTDIDGDTEVDSDGDYDTEEEADGESTSKDTEAPGFKSIRVTINGEFAAEYDIKSDVKYVLPIDAEIVFAVFTTDDTTDSENLQVKTIYRDSKEDVEEQSAVFNNGLWRITMTISPGESVLISSTDEAGNEAVSEYGFIVPSREEAVVATWNKRIYNDEQIIQALHTLQLKEDGSWTENREDTQQSLSGLYSFADGKMLVEGLIPEKVTKDEIDPANYRREAGYYVDSTYFSMENFVKTGGEDADELVGTWQREYGYSYKENDTWSQLSSTKETLEFDSEAKFTWTYENLLDANDKTVYQGTYEVHINESYMDNYGNYLEMQITKIDDENVTDSEATYELFVIRADNLLKKPYIISQQ